MNEMRNKDFEDIPKYRKKANGNISKASYKSKHKHQYKDCLLIYDGRPYKAHYCTICGRARDWDICKEKTEYGYLHLPDELVFKRYKNLEQFEVSTLWGKEFCVQVPEVNDEENI